MILVGIYIKGLFIIPASHCVIKLKWLICWEIQWNSL